LVGIQPSPLGAAFARFLSIFDLGTHSPPEALVRRFGLSISLAFVTCCLSAVPALAGSITFNFNGPALGDAKPSESSNSNPANSIKGYMNKVLADQLGAGFSVTKVWGAKSETNDSYDGDNHVVGHLFNGQMTSMTLGNSEHAKAQGPAGELGTINDLPYDGYIFNSNDTMFYMEFNFPIQAVSFDYQIFPNGSCGDPKPDSPIENPTGSCNRWPDFKFFAGVPGDMDLYLHSTGLDPSDAFPAYDGYRNSPIRPNVGLWEKAPQLLTVSGLIVLNQPSTRLEFHDWPERIGIDNLVISTPEPASFLFVGAGSLILAAFGRRRRG
jgi:hypothetical protein